MVVVSSRALFTHCLLYTSSTNRTVYDRGALVRVTVSLRNHSDAACAYVIGPMSPNFVLTNSSGTTVWGARERRRRYIAQGAGRPSNQHEPHTVVPDEFVSTKLGDIGPITYAQAASL